MIRRMTAGNLSRLCPMFKFDDLWETISPKSRLSDGIWRRVLLKPLGLVRSQKRGMDRSQSGLNPSTRGHRHPDLGWSRACSALLQEGLEEPEQSARGPRNIAGKR